MKFEYIQAMPLHGVAYDTETYAMPPGVKIGKLVCASVGYLDDAGTIQGEILDKEQAAHIFAQLLDDPRRIPIGANITFDLSVLALHAARQNIDLMPAIFRMLEDQRVYDILLAEGLHAIAEGHHEVDPRTGGPIKNAEGKAGRYSLYSVVDLVLGRQDAKANDEWRLRYGELDAIPMDQWPQTALDYPVDDARNTLEAALAQTGHIHKLVAGHEFTGLPGKQACKHCGATTFGGMCRVKARHRNLHDLGNQVGAQFILHMGGSWGFRINQATVDIIEREALRGREGADAPFKALGILREDGSQDLARTKYLVARAYGASDPCPYCKGTGKTQSPKAKVIRCRSCKGACVADKMTPSVIRWKLAHPNGCTDCDNKGEYRDPTHLVVCHAGTEPDPEDETKQRKIKTCDGTGLLLTEDVPRSDKEGVSYGRDVLNESGNDDLVAFAAWDEDKKDLQVYVPFFRRARMPVAGHGPECPHIPSRLKERCTCPGPYKNIPLTLWPNTIVETGRVSYDGIVQLIKRASGYVNELGEYIPSLRECFEARGPRYEIVEVPDDYVLAPGEEVIA